MNLPLTKRSREQIESVCADFAQLFASGLERSGDASKNLSNLEGGIRAYLADTVRRAGSVRTILYRDAGVPLHRMHVPGRFSTNGIILNETELCRHISKQRRIIVSGNAGTGKSVFTKKLALRQIEFSTKRLPILVEMRYISASDSSILHYIRDELFGVHFENVDDNMLDLLMKSGEVTLILDGFDETHFDRREMYRREIDWISRRYPRIEIIISTRPEEETLSLESFSVVRVMPLSLDAAALLIRKIAYEPELRSSFIEKLPEIYDQHHELASNPLLLTMLLLTHDQVGEIPGKMHIFYSQAFETLVLKHDRLKARYVRVTRCAIDLEALKRTYAYFCTLTYATFEISFTESRCVELLRESLDFSNLDFDANDFLNDLLFSYSMLKRDGMYISFVHRSFQEFFCALFISLMSYEELSEAFDQLSSREGSDSCIKMICDLSHEKVLFGWAKPYLKNQKERLQRFANERALASFARDLYGTLQITRDHQLHAGGATSFLSKLMLFNQIAGDNQGRTLLEIRSGTVDTKRIEAFFGIRDPFDYKEFEPTSEDDAWLHESWLETQLDDLLSHLHQALEWIDEVEQKRSNKVKVNFASPERVRPKASYVEFTIKGKPLKMRDKRTGKMMEVPQNEVTTRRVPDPKPRGGR